MPLTRIVLVKHAQPVLDPVRPAREWRLSDEGRSQARDLASALAQFAPFVLATSPEPKARGTSEILAGSLAAPTVVVDGLREIDRPVLPILPADEHRRLNERLFLDLDRRVLGDESAREARDRFTAALVECTRSADANVVVVSHGTVISLFVAEHNPVNAFALWCSLKCPSYVVLDAAYRLV